MKQRKLLGTLAIALTLVLTACGSGGNGGSSKKATHKHEYGDWQTVTAATCTEGGTEKRVCKNSDGLCTKVEDTRTTSALGHQEPSPLVKEEEVPATCEVAGSYKYTCARCSQKVQVDVPATDHDWEDAADQTAATAPTCTETGTKIQVCKNGCGKTQKVSVPALDHDFDEGTPLEIPDENEPNTKGEIPYHWAAITNYSCKRGDVFRYAWSAKEVNFNYKDVAQGAEPELLDEGTDGIRFWGRPIGNAMALSSEGRASSNDDVKIPDPNVKGSRFEFDFIFDKDLTDVCLSAELDPAQYTNDVFKNRSGDQEWTPGYKNIELDPAHPGVHYTQEEINAAVEGDDAYGKTTDDWKEKPQYTGDIIQGMRYIIYLDGVEVPLDGTVNTAPNGRRWYQFPCKLNLTAGKHNLNIAMAGGYLHTFYNFSFEKLPPVHQHDFSGEKLETLTGEGLTPVDVYECPKGDARALRWDAKTFDASSNAIEDPASDGSIRFDHAQGKGGDADKGGHLVYKVKSSAAVTDASLAFYIQAHNQNVDVFNVVSGDSGAGKDVDADGKYTVTPTRRYALYVNDVRVELGDNEYGKTTATDWFTFPAKFNLNQGENKIEIVSLGGYRAKMYNFQLICPIAQ